MTVERRREPGLTVPPLVGQEVPKVGTDGRSEALGTKPRLEYDSEPSRR